MINGQVDIAVHSMKDVPTALPQGIVQAAVLERANILDILVHKGNLDFLENTELSPLEVYAVKRNGGINIQIILLSIYVEM
jgi:porphobilinogen deaminase